MSLKQQTLNLKKKIEEVWNKDEENRNEEKKVK